MTNDHTLTNGQRIVLHYMRTLTASDTTGGELNAALVTQGLAAATNPSAHRRAAELVALGLLENGTPRPCKISGRTVATYRLPTARRAGRVIDLFANLSGAGDTRVDYFDALNEFDRAETIEEWF